jgi:malonyl-CoA O-methyltransferase
MSLTPLDKTAARRSFERAAVTYDHHAVLQREIESRLLERIEFQRVEPEVILDLGCGTGSASRVLSERYQQSTVVALDWSFAMLDKARQHATFGSDTAAGFSSLCADMHQLPLASGSVDLVVSNLALQWAYDLPAIFREFRRVMKAGAMLVFSCYGPDTLYELKQAWQAVDALQHVNDHPDMHDVGDELLVAGFREPVMDAERLTLEYPDVLSLMRELKGLGEHNVAIDRFKGLTGRKRMDGLFNAYEQFRQSDRYPASFEIIYGAAFAPAEGQPVKTPQGDVATFSVDALRRRS